MDIKLTDPIVRVNLIGEAHVENGRLIVGDTDVIESFVRRWGGKRQQGLFTCEFRLVVDEALAVSPSLTGLLSEGTEVSAK